MVKRSYPFRSIFHYFDEFLNFKYKIFFVFVEFLVWASVKIDNRKFIFA